MAEVSDKKPRKASAKVVRDEKGRILPGQQSLNPEGRPKGQSLKEYARDKFAKMTEEEKEKFLAKIGVYEQWKMAEGNPHITGELEIFEPPVPIIDVHKDASVQEDSKTE